jgi:hypothetical protein
MRFDKLNIPKIHYDHIKPLYVFEGNDCVAIKEPGHNWKIKTVPCNNCGECCKRFLMDYDFPPIKKGVCTWLVEGGCELGSHRPFKCAVATPGASYCCVRYEEIKK